jgi:hypothetical protein
MARAVSCLSPAVLLVLLKAAAASATKKAVIGVGWFALTATLKGGRIIISDFRGAVVGAIAVETARRMGFRF